MATYTVATGDQAKHAFALTANTVDTVAFTDNVAAVEIISDGAAAVYYCIGGGTPTVAGANSHLLPAGVVSVATERLAGTAAVDVVKIISAGTPTISVQAA